MRMKLRSGRRAEPSSGNPEAADELNLFSNANILFDHLTLEHELPFFSTSSPQYKLKSLSSMYDSLMTTQRQLSLSRISAF
jgi:hypothetical protein